MKTIISGSRSINSYPEVEKAIEESGFIITEVVSGGARGVDKLGEDYAVMHDIPIKQFLPKFDDENHRSRWLAPLDRNTEMANYAEACIVVWDGKSKGSQDMFKKASAKGLRIFMKVIT